MTAHNPDRPNATAPGVYPCLTYRDVRRAIAWLHTAFGIQGHALAPAGAPADAPLDHALLHAAGGTILVESDRPDELHGSHTGKGWIYVAVADADTHYRHAKAAGAHVHGEPHDFGDGQRGYSATDLEENLWTFGTARP